MMSVLLNWCIAFVVAALFLGGVYLVVRAAAREGVRQAAREIARELADKLWDEDATPRQ